MIRDIVYHKSRKYPFFTFDAITFACVIDMSGDLLGFRLVLPSRIYKEVRIGWIVFFTHGKICMSMDEIRYVFSQCNLMYDNFH